MGSEAQQRKCLIGVKVDESMRAEIDQVARSEAISRSDVVRRAVLRDLRRNQPRAALAAKAQR